MSDYVDLYERRLDADYNLARARLHKSDAVNAATKARGVVAFLDGQRATVHGVAG